MSRVSGDEPEQYGLRQRGYSRDLRPDRRQIVIGVAVDQLGLPLASDVHSGDTSDALTVVPMLTRLQALGLRRVVWVADRGMASEANRSAVRAAGLHYVVGMRLRAVDDLRDAIHADPTPMEQAAEGLQVKELSLNGRRLVVCFSPASAARDLKLRTGAIDRMRPVLERVNTGADDAALTEHGLYRRLVSRGPDGQFHLDKSPTRSSCPSRAIVGSWGPWNSLRPTRSRRCSTRPSCATPATSVGGWCCWMALPLSGNRC